MKAGNIHLFLLLIFLIAACSVNQGESGADGAVIGLISEVSSKSLLEIDWFELEMKDLSTKRFFVEDQIKEFTPTHFRYHMVTGEFVEVHFREEGEMLIAINVVDID
jgi:hypothetical protein|tara:strand:- start:48 stop:368 length:321 start_codon:yes stop_codon:yes gene_type:complete